MQAEISKNIYCFNSGVTSQCLWSIKISFHESCTFSINVISMWLLLTDFICLHSQKEHNNPFIQPASLCFTTFLRLWWFLKKISVSISRWIRLNKVKEVQFECSPDSKLLAPQPAQARDSLASKASMCGSTQMLIAATNCMLPTTLNQRCKI